MTQKILHTSLNFTLNRALTALGVTLALGAAPAVADELPGKGITVQPVKSTIAEETFQTLLVSRALEQLGYDVKPIQEVDYLPAHIAIANGDATFLADHWDPQHEDFYKQSGGDEKMWRDNSYSPDGAQGYLIDKKTADAYNITDISQLKDPKLAALFDHSGDGKADLVGCIPGWFCGEVIDHHIQSYGLSDTVQQVQGAYSALIADTITRYRAGESVLYYGWIPYWVSDVLVPGKDVIWLQVPFSALPGEGADLDTALPNGKNYGFAVNTQRIVANRAFIEAHPAARKLFSIMRLPVGDINAQNRAMHDGANKPADIEQHTDAWIRAHQRTFDDWIEQALAAAR